MLCPVICFNNSEGGLFWKGKEQGTGQLPNQGYITTVILKKYPPRGKKKTKLHRTIQGADNQLKELNITSVFPLLILSHRFW